MNIRLQDGLPYVTIELEHQDKRLLLSNTLLDTGSAGTILAADQLLLLGLQYEAQDTVYRIRGVGGTEFVFTKQVQRLSLDQLEVNNFEVEVGAMDYGIELDGILGMDFLVNVGAVIDLATLKVYKAA